MVMTEVAMARNFFSSESQKHLELYCLNSRFGIWTCFQNQRASATSAPQVCGRLMPTVTRYTALLDPSVKAQ